MPRNKIALFDLDNTLCDYENQMLRDLAAMRSPGEPVIEIYHGKMPAWLEYRMDLVKNQPGWWENLGTKLTGFHLLDMARSIGFCIQVLTKGPRRKSIAWGEKLRWSQKYLGDDIDVTITQDKSGTYGRILVDDFPDYMEKWLSRRPRGLGIMPEMRHNKDFKHARLIKYDGTVSGLEAVRERMQEAFDREELGAS